MKMSKINVKLMTKETYATLKKNIDSYEHYFQENPDNGEWINTISSDPAFETKKFMIEDFELKVPNVANDKVVDLENAITLYEHLKELPRYILSEPRFWLWIMFEKCYETSLKSMENIDKTSFKHQWLFGDGLRRGLFLGILSRLYYRAELTYDSDNKEDPYYLTRYVMESPSRFREITWRTISNQKFVVKAMLKAEIRVNNEIDFDESSKLFTALAKEICKLGSIKLIDAMDEKELENYIYRRYKKLVDHEIESQKTGKYNKAIDLSSVDDVKSIKKAKALFEELNGYMDSQNMISYCENRIKELSKKKRLLSYILKK